MGVGKYANLPNDEYWVLRSQEVYDKQWKDIKKVEKALQKQYVVALDDLKTTVNDFLAKYEPASHTDLYKQLTPVELAEYQRKMARLVQATKDPFLLSEIEALVARATYTRLDALVGQLSARVFELGSQEGTVMEEWLGTTYEEVRAHTAYLSALGTGMGVSFQRLNEAAVKEAIMTPLFGDMFSDRIWDNKRLLIKSLRQTIVQGVIQGFSNQKMARALNKTMENSYKNSLRIVRTETTHVMTQATMKGYEETGAVSSYRFIATLDSRTSSKCGSLDGKVFKLSEQQPGINLPPLHPNCRSAVAPYFGQTGGQRKARDSENNPMYVPADMTYEEWKTKYLN